MALFNRDYMRAQGNFGGNVNASSGGFMRGLPGTRAALLIMVVVFVLETVLQRLFGVYAVREFLPLTASTAPEIWRLVTYGFVHAGFWHILFNGLMLYFLGTMLEPRLGTQRFVGILLTSIVLGGLLYVGIGGNIPLVGASAGVLGLLAYFCLLKPSEKMTFLLFFVVPVSLKPRWLLWFLLGQTAFGMLLGWDPLSILLTSGSIAYTAHLGGILGGFVAFKAFKAGSVWQALTGGALSNISVQRPAGFGSSAGSKGRVKPVKAPRAPKFTVNVMGQQNPRAEVDRILDKINKTGFGSLTVEEKATLEKAKDLL